MGLHLSITKIGDRFIGVLTDGMLPLRFNAIWALGDFYEMRGKSGFELEELLKNTAFTRIRKTLKEDIDELKERVNVGLDLLDEIIKMVQQNEKKLPEKFSDFLMTHNVPLDYSLRPKNTEINFENIEYKQLRHYLDQNYNIRYSCNCIADMVGALYHFYIVNGFRFAKCAYCGKYYANRTGKIIYCDRVNPYIDEFSQKSSSPKTCADAAKAAKRQLMRKMRRIYRKIESKHEFQLGNDTSLYESFSNECGRYQDLIKQEASADNLYKFNKYLEKIETMEVLKE